MARIERRPFDRILTILTGITGFVPRTSCFVTSLNQDGVHLLASWVTFNNGSAAETLFESMFETLLREWLFSVISRSITIQDSFPLILLLKDRQFRLMQLANQFAAIDRQHLLHVL